MVKIKKKLNNHKQIYTYKKLILKVFLLQAIFFKVNKIYLDFFKEILWHLIV